MRWKFDLEFIPVPPKTAQNRQNPWRCFDLDLQQKFSLFRINPIDFDVFDNSVPDSASKIIEMFAKQNKRVMQVFSTSSDDETNLGSDKNKIVSELCCCSEKINILSWCLLSVAAKIVRLEDRQRERLCWKLWNSSNSAHRRRQLTAECRHTSKSKGSSAIDARS